jgi:type IX secretion system PorP/SprF family membrane protein
MFNQMYYNPGYAGDGNDIEARMLVRNQWMGMPGAPNTTTFSVDAPFKLLGQRHGVGLSFVQDVIGNFSNIDINISYAYRKSLMQGELGIGLGLVMVSQSFNDDTWLAPDGTAGSSDNLIPATTDQPSLMFDGNVGLFYTADNLYMSISSRNILNTKVKYSNESENTTQELMGRQIYFSTGYDYQLPNAMYSVQPGVFVATDLASTQVNISGIVTYNKRFFGGLAYKPTDAVIFMAGIDLPSGIHAAVSYDVTTSRIIKYSSGSFEFMAGYSFSLDIDKDNRKYKSVRFL